jgi:hydrogenase-4 component B
LLARTHGDAPWGKLALAGALLHVWNHGAFKALLFFGAGAVLHATGTREMSRLGGLWRMMPWTAGMFAVGSAAVAGLPPLNGFVSEWLIYLGLFDAVAGKQAAAWAAMPAAILLAMAGALALAGALLHVWNHGAFKALLFFGAGAVLHATDTRQMSRLGGLWRRMPWTAGLFALGSLAVAGLPPLNGFVSEWLIYLGLFDAVAGRHAVAWAAIPAAMMLAMAGALAVATFAKAGALMFLGAARTKPAANAHECGGWMRAPMLVLAGLCLALGLAPLWFWPAVSRAAAAWHPPWANSKPLAPLATLGWVHLALAALIVTAGGFLWRKVRSNNLRRGPTWDCGYAVPTARMQYTSGSFAGIAAGWFGWILRPSRTLRRARGHFPAQAMRLEQTPETVLQYAVLPMAARVMRVSTAVRRLQHGRLSAYILYVVAGLTAIGVLVLMESLS